VSKWRGCWNRFLSVFPHLRLFEQTDLLSGEPFYFLVNLFRSPIDNHTVHNVHNIRSETRRVLHFFLFWRTWDQHSFCMPRLQANSLLLPLMETATFRVGCDDAYNNMRGTRYVFWVEPRTFFFEAVGGWEKVLVDKPYVRFFRKFEAIHRRVCQDCRAGEWDGQKIFHGQTTRSRLPLCPTAKGRQPQSQIRLR